MIMKTTSLALALTLVGFVAGCSTIERSRNLADPTVPAQTLAQQVCSNCHGVDGNSPSPNFPNLAAQQPDYVVEQLTSFRSHNRLDPAGFEYMWGLSRHLTDEQIKGLAAYYAAQKSQAPQYRTGKSALVAEGKEIFSKGIAAKNIPGCMECHGPEGQGKEKFPRIANQHADYLVKQLNVFQRTDERPEGAVMKVIAHGLTTGDMEAVAAYLEAGPSK
jgi:cytochrome c553